MKIFIGSGKVATALKKNQDICIPHERIEIREKSSIKEILSKFPKGSTIVNAAAKINLEWCEINKEETSLVNLTGAVNVAEVCAELQHHLIHISSGCVFDGMESEKVYTEEDEPNPAAWYTKTKAAADKAIMNLGYEKITIVRPRQLISMIPNPTNMLTKFLNLKKGNFINSKNSMTCIEDMGVMIDNLVSKKRYGIYNVANSGYMSPFAVAEIIKEKVNHDMDIKSISYEDYLSTLQVKRVNTLLSIEKYVKDTGHTPRSCEAALVWCIDNYGNNL